MNKLIFADSAGPAWQKVRLLLTYTVGSFGTAV